MTLIDRYLSRAIAANMLVTVVLTFMVLTLEELMRLINVLSHTGGPAFLIVQMLVDLLPEYLRLAVPMALFLGVLLTFQRLAQTSELNVLGAIGQSPARLLRMPYAFAAGTLCITALLVGFIEPIAAYRFEQQGFALDTGALGAAVKVGEFNQLAPGMMLRVEESDRGGNRLHGIFASWDRPDGVSTTVTASEGRFAGTSRSDEQMLELGSGRLVETAPGRATRRVVDFASLRLPVRLPSPGAFRKRGSAESELTVGELFSRSLADDPQGSHARGALAELSGRIAELALILILPLFAFALATRTRMPALRVVTGILLLAAFYKLNQYAVHIGARGTLNLFLATWTPFTLLAMLAWRLYYVASRVPGGEPLRPLIRITVMARRILRFVARPRSQANH